MSNSIWKTPEENPKSFSFVLEHYKAYDFDLHKDVAAYNIFETGGNPQNPFDEDTIRWCHLDELLAQADKAERLQKAVDYALKVLDDVIEIGGIDLAIMKIKQMIKAE
jgi:hypothetical protein